MGMFYGEREEGQIIPSYMKPVEEMGHTVGITLGACLGRLAESADTRASVDLMCWVVRKARLRGRREPPVFTLSLSICRE